jgi:hypothetical protein
MIFLYHAGSIVCFISTYPPTRWGTGFRRRRYRDWPHPKVDQYGCYLKVKDVSGEEVHSEAKTLHDRWPKLANDEKRRIAETIVERIVIGEVEIDQMLSCLPTSEELCKSQQRSAPATG